MKVRQQKSDNQSATAHIDTVSSPRLPSRLGASQRPTLHAISQASSPSQSRQLSAELSVNGARAEELGGTCSLLYLNAQMLQANDLLQEKEKREGKLAAMAGETSVLKSLKNAVDSIKYKKKLEEANKKLKALVDEFSQAPADGESQVFIAARTGQTDALALFKKMGIDLNSKNAQGQTLLSAAIEARQWDGLSWLLQQGLDPNVPDNRGQTPLFLAVSRNQREAVKLLLDHGVYMSQVDRTGKMPIHVAAELGNTQVLSYFLQKGVDPNIKTRDGKTPLSLAVERGQRESVSELLTHFTNINQDTNGMTPLEIAVRAQDQDMVTLLLGHGAQVGPGAKRALANLTPINPKIAAQLHYAEIYSVRNKYAGLRQNIERISNKKAWKNGAAWWGDYFTPLGTIGYCFGISNMWGQALLADDLSTYEHRLSLLTHNYQALPFLTDAGKQINSLPELVEAAMPYRRNPQEFKVTSPLDGKPVSYDLVMSIRAFLDGLLLYLYPQHTSLHADNPDYGLSHQNASRSAQYVGNQAGLGRNSSTTALAMLYQNTFVGDKAEFERMLTPLLNEVRRTEAPFFIEVGTLAHSVGLSHTSDGYLLCDANFFNQQLTPPQTKLASIRQVIDTLWERCFATSVTKDGLLALSLSVGSTPHETLKRLAKVDQYRQRHIKTLIQENISRYADLMHTIGQSAERDVLHKLVGGASWQSTDLQTLRRNLVQCVSLQSDASSTVKNNIADFIHQQISLIDAQVLPRADQDYGRLIREAVRKHPETIDTLLIFATRDSDPAALDIYLKEISSLRKQGVKFPLSSISRMLGSVMPRKQYGFAYELLKHQFALNMNSKGLNELHTAINSKDMFAAKLLLHFHPEAVNAQTRDGKTPLLLAAENKQKDMVELLLKQGGDVNQEVNGVKPLEKAVRQLDTEMMSVLIAHGARVDSKLRILASTVSHGRADIMNLIKKAEANGR